MKMSVTNKQRHFLSAYDHLSRTPKESYVYVNPSTKQNMKWESALRTDPLFKRYQGTFHPDTWPPAFRFGTCVPFPFTERLFFHSTRTTLANNSAIDQKIVLFLSANETSIKTWKINRVMEMENKLMLTNEDLENKFLPHRSTRQQPCQAMQVYCSFCYSCTRNHISQKFRSKLVTKWLCWQQKSTLPTQTGSKTYLALTRKFSVSESSKLNLALHSGQ